MRGKGKEKNILVIVSSFIIVFIPQHIYMELLF